MKYQIRSKAVMHYDQPFKIPTTSTLLPTTVREYNDETDNFPLEYLKSPLDHFLLLGELFVY